MKEREENELLQWLSMMLLTRRICVAEEEHRLLEMGWCRDVIVPLLRTLLDVVGFVCLFG
jgi:hypothetical protein